MNKIKVLDNLTIQKIAAGEVVERPSSIVKELIENSLDANSSNIIIEIKNGGKSYIRITDDGNGIEENDLDIAFQRHSTSKLTCIEDLYEIKSLGFRGEALSSISNVSKVEVMTKTSGSLSGIQALVEEGSIVSKEIIGCPKGTTMIIKNLFYNLPVRKKFLKSDLIESNKISDIVYKIALGNPRTSFKFIRDNKIVLNTSKNNNLKSHIYSILGKDFLDNLIEIKAIDPGLKIEGYISNNQLYRANRNHQYLYVNGRYVNNTSISKVIEANFKTILPINRYPVFIIFMDIDPINIDINIHPTKQEVKFAKHDDIINIIDETIKSSLYPSLSLPKLRFSNKVKKENSKSLPLLFDLKQEENQNIEQDFRIKDLTNEINHNEQFGSSEYDIYINEGKDMGSYNPKLMDDTKNTEKLQDESLVDILSEIEPISVIFGTYILAKDKLNKAIYFIDQHAAHERIMYEKYLEEYKKEDIIVQQLLSPEIIDLTSKEMTDVMTNIHIFENLGFDIEQFGSNSIAIRGVPLIFGTPNISYLFYDILDNIEIQIKNSYDIKLEKIMKIACVNAIKSGDYITDLEILSLFDQLKKCKNPHTCPHGRPTILKMTKKDIEKEFLRIT